MNLTIVGLGVLGASLGLALKRADPTLVVTGHDPDAALVARARKLGAIVQSHWNLLSACEHADLILLDLPLNAIANTLTALRAELREGVLILDTAPLKRPVLEWAERILPEGVQFVGTHVVSPRLLPGQAEPSAELLKGATFYVVAPAKAAPWAIEAASRLAAMVGAAPQYIDAVEHDSLVAATLQLPLLGALALVGMVSTSPGWQDRNKCVGGELLALGAMLANAPAVSEGLLANAENVLAWLDEYARRLAGLHHALSARDGPSLDAVLAQATRSYAQWLTSGESPRLEGADGEDVGGWRGMFLGNLGRRPKR